MQNCAKILNDFIKIVNGEKRYPVPRKKNITKKTGRYSHKQNNKKQSKRQKTNNQPKIQTQASQCEANMDTLRKIIDEFNKNGVFRNFSKEEIENHLQKMKQIFENENVQ